MPADNFPRELSNFDFVAVLSRSALERALRMSPFRSGDGTVDDILDPPFTIDRSVNTPLFGSIRLRLICQSITLSRAAGANYMAGIVISVGFKQSSLEVRSTRVQKVGLLSGAIAIEGLLVCQPTPGGESNRVSLGIDFTQATVVNADEVFDASSRERIQQTFGTLASLYSAGAVTYLQDEVRKWGVKPGGLSFLVTNDASDASIFSVAAAPHVRWLGPEKVAIAANDPGVPASQLGNPSDLHRTIGDEEPFSDVALHASPRLFQRCFAKIAATTVAEDYVRRSLNRQLSGDPEAAKKVEEIMGGPQGPALIAAATPAPYGSGKMEFEIKSTVDEDLFPSGSMKVYQLELELGEGRFDGTARATGQLASVGFSAVNRFWAKPAFAAGGGIEFVDFANDDFDIDIELPDWLLVVSAAIAAAIKSPFPPLFVYLTGIILSLLMEAFLKLPGGRPTRPASLPQLPAGMRFDAIRVAPGVLQLAGRWRMSVDDPAPFSPTVDLVDDLTVNDKGVLWRGETWVECIAGTLFPSSPSRRNARKVSYDLHLVDTHATIKVESQNVPLPLTMESWQIQLRGLIPDPIRPARSEFGPVDLRPGTHAVTMIVGKAEPFPVGGSELRSFTMKVEEVADGYQLSFPADAGNLEVIVTAQAVDASGERWDYLSTSFYVRGQATKPLDDFYAAASACHPLTVSTVIIGAPSRLDVLWYPPDVIREQVLRSELGTNVSRIDLLTQLIKEQGVEAIELLLAPSRMQPDSPHLCEDDTLNSRLHRMEDEAT